MRIALLVVVLAVVGCGKKKSPQSPSGESQQLKQDAEEKDVTTPDDADDAPTTRSSDPEEGGE